MTYLKSCFLLIILSFSYEASACIMFDPLTEDDRKQAHSVFIGKVTEYEKASPPEPAKVTFQIIDAISGQEHLNDTITVNWIHGTFGEPNTIEEFRQQYGESTKIGVLFPDIFPEKCSMVESTNGLGQSLGKRELCQSNFIGSGKSTNAWILNKHCSEPYMEAIHN